MPIRKSDFDYKGYLEKKGVTLPDEKSLEDPAVRQGVYNDFAMQFYNEQKGDKKTKLNQTLAMFPDARSAFDIPEQNPPEIQKKIASADGFIAWAKSTGQTELLGADTPAESLISGYVKKHAKDKWANNKYADVPNKVIEDKIKNELGNLGAETLGDISSGGRGLNALSKLRDVQKKAAKKAASIDERGFFGTLKDQVKRSSRDQGVQDAIGNFLDADPNNLNDSAKAVVSAIDYRDEIPIAKEIEGLGKVETVNGAFSYMYHHPSTFAHMMGGSLNDMGEEVAAGVTTTLGTTATGELLSWWTGVGALAAPAIGVTAGSAAATTVAHQNMKPMLYEQEATDYLATHGKKMTPENLVALRDNPEEWKKIEDSVSTQLAWLDSAGFVASQMHLIGPMIRTLGAMGKKIGRGGKLISRPSAVAKAAADPGKGRKLLNAAGKLASIAASPLKLADKALQSEPTSVRGTVAKIVAVEAPIASAITTTGDVGGKLAAGKDVSAADVATALVQGVAQSPADLGAHYAGKFAKSGKNLISKRFKDNGSTPPPPPTKDPSQDNISDTDSEQYGPSKPTTGETSTRDVFDVKRLKIGSEGDPEKKAGADYIKALIAKVEAQPEARDKLPEPHPEHLFDPKDIDNVTEIVGKLVGVSTADTNALLQQVIVNANGLKRGKNDVWVSDDPNGGWAAAMANLLDGTGEGHVPESMIPNSKPFKSEPEVKPSGVSPLKPSEDPNLPLAKRISNTAIDDVVGQTFSQNGVTGVLAKDKTGFYLDTGSEGGRVSLTADDPTMTVADAGLDPVLTSPKLANVDTGGTATATPTPRRSQSGNVYEADVKTPDELIGRNVVYGGGEGILYRDDHGNLYVADANRDIPVRDYEKGKPASAIGLHAYDVAIDYNSGPEMTAPNYETDGTIHIDGTPFRPIYAFRNDSGGIIEMQFENNVTGEVESTNDPRIITKANALMVDGEVNKAGVQDAQVYNAIREIESDPDVLRRIDERRGAAAGNTESTVELDGKTINLSEFPSGVVGTKGGRAFKSRKSAARAVRALGEDYEVRRIPWYGWVASKTDLVESMRTGYRELEDGYEAKDTTTIPETVIEPETTMTTVLGEARANEVAIANAEHSLTKKELKRLKRRGKKVPPTLKEKMAKLRKKKRSRKAAQRAKAIKNAKAIEKQVKSPEPSDPLAEQVAAVIDDFKVTHEGSSTVDLITGKKEAGVEDAPRAIPKDAPFTEAGLYIIGPNGRFGMDSLSGAITTVSGKPFRSIDSADAALRTLDLEDTHSVGVSADGEGYELHPIDSKYTPENYFGEVLGDLIGTVGPNNKNIGRSIKSDEGGNKFKSKRHAWSYSKRARLSLTHKIVEVKTKKGNIRYELQPLRPGESPQRPVFDKPTADVRPGLTDAKQGKYSSADVMGFSYNVPEGSNYIGTDIITRLRGVDYTEIEPKFVKGSNKDIMSVTFKSPDGTEYSVKRIAATSKKTTNVRGDFKLQVTRNGKKLKNQGKNIRNFRIEPTVPAVGESFFASARRFDGTFQNGLARQWAKFTDTLREASIKHGYSVRNLHRDTKLSSDGTEVFAANFTNDKGDLNRLELHVSIPKGGKHAKLYTLDHYVYDENKQPVLLSSHTGDPFTDTTVLDFNKIGEVKQQMVDDIATDVLYDTIASNDSEALKDVLPTQSEPDSSEPTINSIKEVRSNTENLADDLELKPGGHGFVGKAGDTEVVLTTDSTPENLLFDVTFDSVVGRDADEVRPNGILRQLAANLPDDVRAKLDDNVYTEEDVRNIVDMLPQNIRDIVMLVDERGQMFRNEPYARLIDDKRFHPYSGQNAWGYFVPNYRNTGPRILVDVTTGRRSLMHIMQTLSEEVSHFAIDNFDIPELQRAYDSIFEANKDLIASDLKQYINNPSEPVDMNNATPRQKWLLVNEFLSKQGITFPDLASNKVSRPVGMTDEGFRTLVEEAKAGIKALEVNFDFNDAQGDVGSLFANAIMEAQSGITHGRRTVVSVTPNPDTGKRRLEILVTGAGNYKTIKSYNDAANRQSLMKARRRGLTGSTIIPSSFKRWLWGQWYKHLMPSGGLGADAERAILGFSSASRNADIENLKESQKLYHKMEKELLSEGYASARVGLRAFERGEFNGSKKFRKLHKEYKAVVERTDELTQEVIRDVHDKVDEMVDQARAWFNDNYPNGEHNAELGKTVGALRRIALDVKSSWKHVRYRANEDPAYQKNMQKALEFLTNPNAKDKENIALSYAELKRKQNAFIEDAAIKGVEASKALSGEEKRKVLLETRNKIEAIKLAAAEELNEHPYAIIQNLQNMVRARSREKGEGTPDKTAVNRKVVEWLRDHVEYDPEVGATGAKRKALNATIGSHQDKVLDHNAPTGSSDYYEIQAMGQINNQLEVAIHNLSEMQRQFNDIRTKSRLAEILLNQGDASFVEEGDYTKRFPSDNNLGSILEHIYIDPLIRDDAMRAMQDAVDLRDTAIGKGQGFINKFTNKYVGVAKSTATVYSLFNQVNNPTSGLHLLLLNGDLFSGRIFSASKVRAKQTIGGIPLKELSETEKNKYTKELVQYIHELSNIEPVLGVGANAIDLQINSGGVANAPNDPLVIAANVVKTISDHALPQNAKNSRRAVLEAHDAAINAASLLREMFIISDDVPKLLRYAKRRKIAVAEMELRVDPKKFPSEDAWRAEVERKAIQKAASDTSRTNTDFSATPRAIQKISVHQMRMVVGQFISHAWQTYRIIGGNIGLRNETKKLMRYADSIANDPNASESRKKTAQRLLKDAGDDYRAMTTGQLLTLGVQGSLMYSGWHPWMLAFSGLASATNAVSGLFDGGEDKDVETYTMPEVKFEAAVKMLAFAQDPAGGVSYYPAGITDGHNVIGFDARRVDYFGNLIVPAEGWRDMGASKIAHTVIDSLVANFGGGDENFAIQLYNSLAGKRRFQDDLSKDDRDVDAAAIAKLALDTFLDTLTPGAYREVKPLVTGTNYYNGKNSPRELAAFKALGIRAKNFDLRQVVSNAARDAAKAKSKGDFMIKVMKRMRNGTEDIKGSDLTAIIDKIDDSTSTLTKKYSDFFKTSTGYFDGEREVIRYGNKTLDGNTTGLKQEEVKGLIQGKNIFKEYWKKRVENAIKQVKEKKQSRVDFTETNRAQALLNLERLKAMLN